MDFERDKFGCPWFVNGSHHDDPELNEEDMCKATDEECSQYNCAILYWARKEK